MAQYQIPLSHVYRHFDVTGKHCPRYFVEESAWRRFKSRLEDPTVTQDQFNQMMEIWLSQQAAKEASVSSHSARQWAEENGIITGFSDGSKQYKGFCTREQVVLMLHRFLKTLNPN
jgi:N-acetylmuramoyl-L-alanine amidase CwlA